MMDQVCRLKRDAGRRRRVRWWRSVWPFGLVWLFAVVTPCAADQPQGPRDDEPDAKEFRLWVRNHVTDAVRLRICRNGESTNHAWRRAFEALYRFHDTNNDGAITPTEAAELPDPLDLHGILWGRFVYGLDHHADWRSTDGDRNGRITLNELTDLYRGRQIGGPVVAVGESSCTIGLSEALLRKLDTDASGTLSRDECEAADEVLSDSDANGDRLLGPGELIAGIRYPGAKGTTVLPPGTRLKTDFPLIRRFPIRWNFESPLPVGEKDNPNPTHRYVIDASNDALASDRSVRFSRSKVRLHIRQAKSKLPNAFETFQSSVMAVYHDADIDGDDRLEQSEIGEGQREVAGRLLEACDRDRDGCLMRSEVEAWLEVRRRMVAAQCLVTVLDQGHGLFECLDTDRDGGLSRRERRQVWQHLREANDADGDRIDLSDLPQQVLIVVSNGAPEDVLARPLRGPSWFRNMDRNQDGDLDGAEFLGDSAIFVTLDHDGDGLIDHHEASSSPAGN